MSEHVEEPYFTLKLDGQEFLATPENTTLFSFIGKTAIQGVLMENERFDHVFFQHGESDEQTVRGTYMFRTDNNHEKFDAIAEYMVETDFPMVINQRHLPQCDIDAYFRLLDQMASRETIPDELPDWMDGA